MAENESVKWHGLARGHTVYTLALTLAAKSNTSGTNLTAARSNTRRLRPGRDARRSARGHLIMGDEFATKNGKAGKPAGNGVTAADMCGGSSLLAPVNRIFRLYVGDARRSAEGTFGQSEVSGKGICRKV